MATSGSTQYSQSVASASKAPTSGAVQNLLYEQIGTESIKKPNDFVVETSDGGAEGDINPLPDLSD